MAMVEFISHTVPLRFIKCFGSLLVGLVSSGSAIACVDI